MMYVQFMKEVPSRRKLEMHISGNLYSAKVLGHVALPANVGDLVVAKSFIVIAHLIFYILDPILFISFYRCCSLCKLHSLFLLLINDVKFVLRDDQIQSSSY